MGHRPAEFVRAVDWDEDLKDVVNEAKADTWVRAREHAVLLLADNTLVMVRGGRDGIELTQLSDGSLSIQVASQRKRVMKLAWHTHPEPTGPSDHDCLILDLLEHATSVIYEIRGDPDGTVFRGKRLRRD